MKRFLAVGASTFTLGAFYLLVSFGDLFIKSEILPPPNFHCYNAKGNNCMDIEQLAYPAPHITLNGKDYMVFAEIKIKGSVDVDNESATNQ